MVKSPDFRDLGFGYSQPTHYLPVAATVPCRFPREDGPVSVAYGLKKETPRWTGRSTRGEAHSAGGRGRIFDGNGEKGSVVHPCSSNKETIDCLDDSMNPDPALF